MSMNLTDVVDLLHTFSDKATPLVTDSTLFFSAEFDLKSLDETHEVLTHARVDVMMSRGGGLYTIMSLNTMVLNLQTQSMGLLLLFIIALLRLTVITVLANIIAAKLGAWRTDVFRFHNFIDMLMIIVGWVIMGGVALETMGARNFSGLFDEYETQRATIANDGLMAFDSAQVIKIQDEIKLSISVSQELCAMVANYNVLLVIRFLIATMGHPRLAIIMKTLLNGMGDLLHLFFVFILIFMAYVMSGHILMGSRMPEMSTIKGSFGYCLRIVFAREYEYARITEQDMLTAGFWIITFVLLLVLVMVNMMLAMIFDNYGEVREHVFKSETIFAFFRRLLSQLQMQSVWNSNTELLKTFSAQIPVGSSPTFKQLTQDCPEVPRKQLALIFDHAAQKQQQALFSANRNQIPEHIAGLLIALRDVREGCLRMKRNGGPPRPGSMVGRDTEIVVNDMNNGADPKTDPKNGQPATTPKEATEVDEDASVHEIAQEGTEGEEVDMGGAPPLAEPEWIQGGLIEHLKKQQQAMEAMMKQMSSMQESMAKRGIKGKADFKTARPPLPTLAPADVINKTDDSPKRSVSGRSVGSRSQSPGSGEENAGKPLVNRPRRTYEIREQRPGDREPGTPTVRGNSRSRSPGVRSSQ